jgi:hypothetical protein
MKNKLMLIILLSSFIVMFSCSTSYIEIGFNGSSKPMSWTHFLVSTKIKNKKYKIGDTITLEIFSGSQNYYEFEDGELKYVANLEFHDFEYYKNLYNITLENYLENYSRHYEYYKVDPYENFGVQLLYRVGKDYAVSAYLELPNFRTYSLSYSKPVNEEYHAIYSNSDKLSFTLTEDIVKRRAIYINLVDYINIDELTVPLLSGNDYYDGRIRASTYLYFTQKENYVYASYSF